MVVAMGEGGGRRRCSRVSSEFHGRAVGGSDSGVTHLPDKAMGRTSQEEEGGAYRGRRWSVDGVVCACARGPWQNVTISYNLVGDTIIIYRVTSL